MELKKSEKICKIYECETCEYITRDKRDYDKHLSTRKHKRKQMETNVSTNFQCSNCDKKYKTRAGLWKHNKLCEIVEEFIEEEKTIAQNIGGQDNELVMLLVKNQTDFQNLVVTQMTTQQQQINEIIPKIGNTNTMTNSNNTMNNTTNNNNKFNMNIYLYHYIFHLFIINHCSFFIN